ncbi:ABC transporter ATP-binding protein [Nitratireductor sp. XY-223]|uniref:ABC transporter ATP-binding protein n=1 Tax=Nitratireductor sp. XY-223 TaxID=2561926 RepID=UPI0010AA123B|nr:ABC transporter ATP-binding protein [Nitratireductor sp. XY-223]
MTILETRKLSRRFGALNAVSDVSLSLEAGEVRAIIGPNGAGKTTLFNLITGKLAPTGGKVIFEGADVTGVPAHALVRRGIGRSFQITNIFPRLSVFENILVGVLAGRGKTTNLFASLLSFETEAAEAREILDRVELGAKAGLPVSALSHGERRNLELGLTLALNPRLILLDEPTAGMSVEETASTVALIRRVAQSATVLFTEHDMGIVFSIADNISVLHQGSIIAEGTPEEIKGNRTVQVAYLGEEA